ncbi:DUF29 domain-containing protein [Methylobacterium sp. E-025]|uniref:DUF29 domain-containing protein n=1 Tax=unclassified Methylobacterium TaxID=2615210 RepID=UPI001FBA3A26|nr:MULTISPECIES: DUF29 domain-containing protein [unclassified Methylobacterium]MCJ2041836.1 DUF29 domain-containing protein [Methylobacterium sp. J-059]MCJ2112537.1 DUF29 domain-containing protein [Methylobacterium sp. E-025]
MTASAKAARPAETGTAYADDFYAWTQEQGARLRAGDLTGLDRENLAEEIESLGRSQFSSLVGAWRIVLLHMLKWDHQPSRRTRSWVISIATHRVAAADELADSPGLKSRRVEAMERAYRRARLEAADETGLPLKTFPETCPYTHDEMLTRPFAIDPDDTTA